MSRGEPPHVFPPPLIHQSLPHLPRGVSCVRSSLLEDSFPRHRSAARCNPTRKLPHVPCRVSVAAASSFFMPCLGQGELPGITVFAGALLTRSFTPSGK